MTVEFDLGLHRTISNAANLDIERVDATLPGDIEGDILLLLRPASPGFEFTLTAMPRGHPLIFERGVSVRSEIEIFARVQECRIAWEKYVVHHSRIVAAEEGGERNDIPFQQRWDLRCEPDVLEEAAPHLARAGARLFTLIFERECDNGQCQLAATLRNLLRGGSRHLCVSSDAIFLPWGMLYAHPVPDEMLLSSGSNWKPEGFWGYQHIIQHMPMRHDPAHEKIIPTNQGVLVSLNLDERISQELGLPSVDDHFRRIGELPHVALIRRTLKRELEKAFTNEVAGLERILYFYCHGSGANDNGQISLEEAKLSLTDDFVSAADLQEWSGETLLPTNPLVFINACQGGQMTTVFYKSFAVELLKQGAVGLVGAQIDIPAVFAAEYACRVFRDLFTKGKQIRLGRQLRDANRDFWDTHKNPLGLVYSLYRGVNCFIDWPEA
jgi:hypothetical protein